MHEWSHLPGSTGKSSGLAGDHCDGAKKIELKIGHIAALMRHAAKSTTYKPALLKALVRCCQRSDALTLPLISIGREFSKLYWNQTVIYHLRQASSLTKESEAVKLIRKTADQYRARDISALPDCARQKLDAGMARLLTINVLAAFHTSKPADMPVLYEWKPGQDYVRIGVASHAFLTGHAQALELIANFYWAEFLENCNRLAPRIVQKVARDAARRGSLSKYLKILANETPQYCFYCEVPFGGKTPTVDHVIPWSFLLEEGLWDLVLACAKCNGAKSDLLPTRDFLDKLIERNEKLSTAGISLGISDAEIKRLYEAAISVEWPGPWGI